MTGKKRKRLLIILGAVLALLLAGAGGALLWQRWTPAQIGDRVRLEDLEPNQAVLALGAGGLAEEYLVVDNRGRWKLVFPNGWDDETLQWFRQHEYYPRVEFYDLLLENDAFPYGKGRVPRRLLKWAINMESAALKSVPEEKEPINRGCVPHITLEYEYWAIARVGDERKEVLLRREKINSYATKVTGWSDDIRIALMCNKLGVLKGDESALRKKHFFIGLCIAFVLLLALIAGTWFRRRRVSRNREETHI